jgi:molybdopterin molybdotransferase
MPDFWTSKREARGVGEGMRSEDSRQAVEVSRTVGAARSNPPGKQGFGSLWPIKSALAELRARSRLVEPRLLPIGEAAGRVLAEPMRSPAPVPAHPTALRDGWAVAAGDVVGASSYSPVVVAAPSWVEAGQPMPAGTDAVLPPDAVTAQNGLAEIVADVAPGEGTRRAGDDARSGTILREAGEWVRPSDIAVARVTGIEQVLVREARVHVLSVPGPPALDASTDLVARLAEGTGAVVERTRLPCRDASDVAGALSKAESDLVLIVGGTGLGRGNHAAAALAASGSLIAHGIALRPGETCGCGVVGTTPAILMSGFVDSALAATLTLVLPCLDHLMGAAPRLPSLAGPLTRKVSSAIGMAEIVLLRRVGDGLEPLAGGDLTLAAIAGADAWLAVPPDSEGYAGGETVAAFLL